jgi:segregation and condensation protein A
VTPLGELTVRWTGDDDTAVDELVTDEFDGSPDPATPATPGAPGQSARESDERDD